MVRVGLFLLVAPACRLGFFEVQPMAETCDDEPVALWQRQFDWGPENPTPDKAGRPTWHYERVQGGPLGAANVWYAQPPVPLVWDANWFGGGGGQWVRSDDVLPTASFNGLVLGNRIDLWPDISLVRWRNPTGRALALRIEAVFEVTWSGSNDAAMVDVELSIAHLGTTGVAELSSQLVAKPTPTRAREATITTTPTIDVDVLAGESLVMSGRALDHDQGNDTWVTIEDYVTLELVRCD